TTTKSIPCAAWISSSSRPRKPTPRPGHCSRASTCLSRTDRLRRFLVPHGKEELDREECPPRQADAANQPAPRPPQGDRARSRGGAGRPFRGAAQDVRAAAQQLGDTAAQPLFPDRAAARLLSQV